MLLTKGSGFTFQYQNLKRSVPWMAAGRRIPVPQNRKKEFVAELHKGGLQPTGKYLAFLRH